MQDLLPTEPLLSNTTDILSGIYNEKQYLENLVFL